MGYGVVASILLILLVISAVRKRQPTRKFVDKTISKVNDFDLIELQIVPDPSNPPVEDATVAPHTERFYKDDDDDFLSP